MQEMSRIFFILYLYPKINSMPFTFSHPAIVLPITYLSRRWYSLTGLVIGSIMPDFEYFLRMRVKSDDSHTLAGVFYFDIPLGIIMCFIFHQVVRNPSIVNMPAYLNKRFCYVMTFDWPDHFKKTWFTVIVSLLIGTMSHVFWDSFTHENAYFVRVISGLQTNIPIFSLNIPLYKLLQHLSSTVGAVVIVIAVNKLPSSAGAINNQYRYRFWLTTMLISIAVATLRVLIAHKRVGIGDIVVSYISASMLALVIVSIAYSHLMQTDRHNGDRKAEV